MTTAIEVTRTEALCKVLGWQGGTIHQIAQETGCDVQELLYSEPKETHLTSSNSFGWSAARTNDVAFNRKKIFPQYRGNVDFWLGAARGMQLKIRGI